MAVSSSDMSFTSSPTISQDSEQKSFDSFDSSLSSNGSARGVKVAKPTQVGCDDLKQFKRMFSDALVQQSNGNQSCSDTSWKQRDTLALHRGLEAIASQLSLLTNTLGTALEEQRSNAQAKATTLKNVKLQGAHMNGKNDNFTEEKLQGAHMNGKNDNFTEEKLQGAHMNGKNENSTEEKLLNSPPKSRICAEKMMPDISKDTQVCPEKMPADTAKGTQAMISQDLAAAMANKAKLLLNELRRIKQEMNFIKDRCAQLEEENKRLRESIDKGVRHEEDDLVRLQLETLLTEKARLAQENSSYAKENQFLHELVQYHQLKLRNITLPDDDTLALDDEILGFDAASPLDMDLVPLYPQDEDADLLVEEPLAMADCT